MDTLLADPLNLTEAVAETGMTLPQIMTLDDWLETGNRLLVWHKSLQFAIGDFLIYGFEHFGEEAAQLIDEANAETCRKAKYVCERIPTDRRRPELTFSHHDAVASLPPEQQDELLELAIKNNWRRSALREEILRRAAAEARARMTQPERAEALADFCNDVRLELVRIQETGDTPVRAIDITVVVLEPHFDAGRSVHRAAKLLLAEPPPSEIIVRPAHGLVKRPVIIEHAALPPPGDMDAPQVAWPTEITAAPVIEVAPVKREIASDDAAAYLYSVARTTTGRALADALMTILNERTVLVRIGHAAAAAVRANEITADLTAAVADFRPNQIVNAA